MSEPQTDEIRRHGKLLSFRDVDSQLQRVDYTYDDRRLLCSMRLITIGVSTAGNASIAANY